MPLSICAVIAVRNEYAYLRELLPRLAVQRIDLVVIDHESTDGSDEFCRAQAGSPVVAVESMPFRGVFSLAAQLDQKARVIASLRHDWVIHQDADELLEPREGGPSLRDAIEVAHAAGHTALNFDEFVFLPRAERHDPRASRHLENTRYYFFDPQPGQQRLQRAWRRDAALENRASGGHTLSGARLSVGPGNHNLRHYIGLSQQHLFDKYLGRRFDAAEVRRGWHGPRIGLAREHLTIPRAAPALLELPHPASRDLRRDHPSATHYWEWAVAGQ